MPWKIIEQTEKHGKEEVPVECKWVKFSFDEKKGNFFPLKFVIFQIVIRNDKGDELKVKWDNYHGLPGRFTIQHPDKYVLPTIVVGSGKNRRVIEDYLAKEKIKKPGDKWRYETDKEFTKECTRMFGPELTGRFLDLFVAKMGQVFSR